MIEALEEAQNSLPKEDKKNLCIILNRQYLKQDSKEYIIKLSHPGLEWLNEFEDSILKKG